MFQVYKHGYHKSPEFYIPSHFDYGKHPTMEATKKEFNEILTEQEEHNRKKGFAPETTRVSDHCMQMRFKDGDEETLIEIGIWDTENNTTIDI